MLPYIVPLCIDSFCVFPKCSPISMVLECEYILLVKVTAFTRYPRSFIMANNLAWSIDPKAFLKSIYNRYMSSLMKCASSRATISSWICLDVHLFALNPSWLSYKI